MPAQEPRPAASSQTLSRGIQMLELLARQTAPTTIASAAAQLGVHRSIAYRILRTLEDHDLVERDASGFLRLGAGLAALAQNVAKELQTAALPELNAIANELGMTAFLVVLEKATCITLQSAEPRDGMANVARKPGSRHQLDVGAPGIAIQSALDDADRELLLPGVPLRSEVLVARSRGYATSRNEVIEGLAGVSVPLRIPGRRPGALAVVYISSDFPEDAIATRLGKGAAAISAQLG
ncbi:DNA-binding IclR family transcriptional regulator [Arthrobacter sp. CAN_A6]|uniref:IclR family transcriptional regulator n=1 Tax=Arthrobacter sp. CAN_A6 TaxID=2787721 RepID=UPI0018C99806